MPEYPLSSKLLALLSGSFYGTAGTRQERKARRRIEARRDEKDEKELEKVENERRNETQKRGRWSTKMAEGQDKPLCPRGPRGNVVSVSYFANPAIIFYTALIPLSPPSPSSRQASLRGPENLSFFVISLFGPSISSVRSFRGTAPPRR